MTVEQKAEEYAKNLLKDVTCNIGHPRARQINSIDIEDAWLYGYKEGFKDCAKSRLNVTTISDCPIKDEEESKYKTAYIRGIRTMANALKDYDRTDGAWTDYFEHTVDNILKDLLKEIK